MNFIRQFIVFLFSTVTLTAPASASVADMVEIANSTRLEGCQPSAELRPLRGNPRLDEAARRVAQGQALEAAIAGAGYRARVSASIHVATKDGDAGVAPMLSRRFCGILADPEVREIGAFQRGEDTWLVLAGPLIPSEAATNALDGRVLALINEARGERRRCGPEVFPATTPLRSDEGLREAALAHARDLAVHGHLGHEGSDGSMPADRVARTGYRWQAVAENVAGGQPSAEEVVNTWLASPGHCRNLMDPRYSGTGIAHAINRKSEKGIYWVQVFATPR